MILQDLDFLLILCVMITLCVCVCVRSKQQRVLAAAQGFVLQRELDRRRRAAGGDQRLHGQTQRLRSSITTLQTCTFHTLEQSLPQSESRSAKPPIPHPQPPHTHTPKQRLSRHRGWIFYLWSNETKWMCRNSHSAFVNIKQNLFALQSHAS